MRHSSHLAFVHLDGMNELARRHVEAIQNRVGAGREYVAAFAAGASVLQYNSNSCSQTQLSNPMKNETRTTRSTLELELRSFFVTFPAGVINSTSAERDITTSRSSAPGSQSRRRTGISFTACGNGRQLNKH